MAGTRCSDWEEKWMKRVNNYGFPLVALVFVMGIVTPIAWRASDRHIKFVDSADTNLNVMARALENGAETARRIETKVEKTHDLIHDLRIERAGTNSTDDSSSIAKAPKD